MGFKKGNNWGSKTPWTKERRAKVGNAHRRTKVAVECNFCNQEFRVHKFETKGAKKRKFCTQKCFHAFNKQENHYEWKGGLSELSAKIRRTKQYIAWRKFIFSRDNYTCVLCEKSKEVTGRLEADHYPTPKIVLMYTCNIKTVEDALNCKEMWNTDNGRTVCRKCHTTTTTYGGGARRFLKLYKFLDSIWGK